MSHSEIGPHSGQIRLKDDTRITATKAWGRWHAKGMPDYPNLAALEAALERKHRRTPTPPPPSKAESAKGSAWTAKSEEAARIDARMSLRDLMVSKHGKPDKAKPWWQL